MNEIDPNKYIDIINRNKKENNIRKYFKNLIIRIAIVLIIFLSFAIICNYSSNFKDIITKYVFIENISFTKINKIYNNLLGGILPIKKDSNTMEVFNEKLNYSNLSVYYDGVNLSVSGSYLVPSLKEGMVVFIGNKEKYGNTIIIEDLDGVYIWYGNIITTSLKLYDYVEEGTLVGEVNNNFYMVFSKDNKYLDYEEYIN